MFDFHYLKISNAKITELANCQFRDIQNILKLIIEVHF